MMVRASGLTQNRFSEEILGIKGVNLSRAKASGKIPERWFDKVKELYGVSKEELCRIKEDIQVDDILPRINSGMQEQQTMEDGLPMVRNYRELAQMDADTLGEIQTWINDMEQWRPGFTSWFRLEFQNRFPEFDDWKSRVTKKSTGTGD